MQFAGAVKRDGIEAITVAEPDFASFRPQRLKCDDAEVGKSRWPVLLILQQDFEQATTNAQKTSKKMQIKTFANGHAKGGWMEKR